jgi:RNA polymerase sigma-70 factor (ECF subfamily)
MSRSLKEQYLFLKLRATRDPEVYGKLYDIYVDEIYRFIFFKVSSKEEAEDLTGEVFLKTWQYINEKDAKPVDNLRAFLYQTARNTVIDYYRTKGSREESIDEMDDGEPLRADLADPKQDLAEKIELSSGFETAKKALQKLKGEYREVIMLRFVQEMSIKEVAEVLGKPEGSIRVLLHRAVSSLKDKMPREAK